MTRMFVFQDFKSQKFWSITMDDKGFTVKYGKLGTNGQTQVKTFDSDELATKEAEKLIAEKVKKGYIETTVDKASDMKVEAKRYEITYSEYENNEEISGGEVILKKILKDKQLPEIKQITIGPWTYVDGGCESLIDGIVANKEKFQHIEGFFLGDIDSEEMETSWIELPSVAPLLNVLPNLKDFKIKGGSGFEFGKRNHETMRSIEIITGSLPASLVKEIAESDYPNLEKLVFWIGDDGYGGDCTVETFKPILAKGKFPKLKHLGLKNSDIQDDLVKLVMDSPILAQLEELDFSKGTLSDDGGQVLLDNADKLKHIKMIDMEYHYMTKEMMQKLKKLPCKVNVSDPQDPEDDYKTPFITE